MRNVTNCDHKNCKPHGFGYSQEKLLILVRSYMTCQKTQQPGQIRRHPPSGCVYTSNTTRILLGQTRIGKQTLIEKFCKRTIQRVLLRTSGVQGCSLQFRSLVVWYPNIFFLLTFSKTTQSWTCSGSL